MTVQLAAPIAVCLLTELPVERGVAALVISPERTLQVAIVRTADDAVYCIGHHDPYSGANVMARGLVGTRAVDGDVVPTIASPMYKQVFDLRTGRALDDPAVCLGAWEVIIRAGEVFVGRQLEESTGVPEAS